jgi:hypothetical protein
MYQPPCSTRFCASSSLARCMILPLLMHLMAISVAVVCAVVGA